MSTLLKEYNTTHVFFFFFFFPNTLLHFFPLGGVQTFVFDGKSPHFPSSDPCHQNKVTSTDCYAVTKSFILKKSPLIDTTNHLKKKKKDLRGSRIAFELGDSLSWVQNVHLCVVLPGKSGGKKPRLKAFHFFPLSRSSNSSVIWHLRSPHVVP